MNYKHKAKITIFALGAGIFLLGQVLLAADSDIIINEIGAYEANDYEWIEIFNISTSAIDITGWKFYENNTNHSLSLCQGADMTIESGEYAIIADVASNFASSHPAFSGTIIDSSWGSLNESGELIELRTSSDPADVLESFTYLPASNYSLERASPTTTDYTGNNWWEHSFSHTAGAQNSNYNQSPPNNTSSPVFSPSDLVVNEFISDPSDENNEWIELYNNTTTADLTGWTIEDGVGIILNLSGSINASDFLVFELSANKLNNAGDIIILKDNTGQIIDQVSYGNWDDGNIDDNAPMAEDPNSTARNTDGADTDIDNNDFSFTTTATNGVANVINSETPTEPNSPPPANTNGNTTALPSYSPSDVIINELLIDPIDNEEEWVELYNNTNDDIVLMDWTIEDGSEKISELSGVIAPGGFLVIEEELKSTLNNAGDIIILYDPNGMEIDKVTYGGWHDGNLNDNAPKAPDPNSLSRRRDGIDTNNDFNDFTATHNITKGAANIISQTVQNSNSNNWPSGVIINEIYPNPKGNDKEAEFVELKNTGELPVDLTNWQLGDSSAKKYTLSENDFDSLIIRPGEFFLLERKTTGIALNNSGTEIVNLYQPNLSLADNIAYTGKAPEKQSFSRNKNGGWKWTLSLTPGLENIITKPNQPPEAVISISRDEIQPGEKIIFDGSDSSDDQNTDLKYIWDFGDSNAGNEIITEHNYDEAGEYRVYLTVIDDYGLSHTAEQIIYVGEYLPPLKDNSPPFIRGELEEGMEITHNNDYVFEVNLNEVKNLFKGDKVRVKGTVAVEPGVLGSQIFYLAGSGVQIYCYNKDFPNLQVGDYVKIDGELSEAGGETRIKIKQQKDIEILKKGATISPHNIGMNEVGEDFEGSLVKVAGEVIEKRGNSIYLDDGEDEIKIYVKKSTGIKLNDLKIKTGDWLTITGIVSQTNSGYRILPRYQSDIVKSQVLSAKKDDKNIPLSKYSLPPGLKGEDGRGYKKEEISNNKYLMATLIFFAATTIWLDFKHSKLKQKGWEIIER